MHSSNLFGTALLPDSCGAQRGNFDFSLFMFQESFSNLLPVLKQLFGCLQLFINKQLLGFYLSKIILLKQLFGANILVLKQLFGATCDEAIICFFAPCQVNPHISPCYILSIKTMCCNSKLIV